MKILAHRGCWLNSEDANTLAAFRRGRSAGFGAEIDIRDCLNELVVSHDPAVKGSLLFSEVLSLYDDISLPLAVNVKADGLSDSIARLLSRTAIDWFVFDMSVPEALRYARLGLPFFTRHSDIEPTPVLYREASGVWLDAFNSDWFSIDVIAAHLAAGKRVCVVSPELHGRDPYPVWKLLRSCSEDLMICTDLPDEADSYFNA